MGWESVYDSEKGTFLGRTAMSWIKILGFYAIYYTLLGFLFYGSVKVGMLRINNSNILGLTRGIKTPVIRSRTDQPGVDAWPQNMVIEDNQGQEFELATYEKNYGKEKNQYPVYIQKLEEFLLNHCPFENECSFKQILGDDWASKIDFVVKGPDATEDAVGCKPEQAQSRKCLVFNEKCSKPKGNKKCGKIMEIDHTKLKAQIANSTDNRITKPFFFISINKVIGFELKNFDDLEYMIGLNPKKGLPSPTLQYNPKDFALNATLLKQAAFVNCYVFDIEAKKGNCDPWKKTDGVIARDGEAGSKVPCDNMKTNKDYRVSPIQPFILNDNYKYTGYGDNADENIAAATYAKPFAMFQMSMAEEKESTPIKNLEDKSLIRCNVVAKNIEYPYLDSDQLMGNALLGQPGHGWVQLGFRTLEVEQEK